jgi:type I restriction enzyme S subunit
MRLETFFEKFELFAEAPNALERIRRLVLDAAVKGMLVDQCPNDEPASILIARIHNERKHLEKKGEIKKEAQLEQIELSPYKLPTGWEWTRLGNTGRIFNGSSVSESEKNILSKVAEGLPFIATKDVGYGRDRLAYENGLKVPFDTSSYKVARAEAVLICAEGGSAGKKVGQTDRDICFGNKLYANEVWPGIDPRYILLVYQTTGFFNEFADKMTGIIGGIARSEFLRLPVPIPPENEQKRIVAKVDELMSLCDRLEAQQHERDTRHKALARASLTRFSDVPTPANLNLLFHLSYDIAPADIRKTILALAMQGKLVSQDPNDEPAAVLLPRIQKRRAELHKLYQLPKPSEPTRIDYDSEVHLPDSWVFVRIGELCLSIVPQRDKPLSFSGNIPWVTLPCFSENAINLNKGYDQTGLSLDEIATYRLRVVPAGSVLMSCIGRFGLVALLDQDVVPNQQLHGFCFPSELLDGRFLCYTIIAQKDYLASQATTTTIAYLNKTKCESVPVALPPLAEQRRIVAKVDQLMALVDRLETQLANSRIAAINLIEAVVAELTKQE